MITQKKHGTPIFLTPLLDSLKKIKYENSNEYQRAPPEYSNLHLLNKSLYDVCQQKWNLLKQAIPECGFVLIRNAWISHDTIFVNDSPVIETYAHPLEVGESIQNFEVNRALMRWEKLRDFNQDVPYQKIEECVFCQRPGSANNYGHFLTDCVPVISAATFSLPEIPLAIPRIGKMSYAAKKILVENHGNSEIIFLDQISFCKKIWIPYGFNSHVGKPGQAKWKRQNLPDILKKYFLKFKSIGKSEEKNNCLLVLREDGASRRLENVAEIFKMLTGIFDGVELYKYEGQTIEEQAAIFNSHQFVIGTRGADMTNTIFMEHNSKVVHLSPANSSVEYFWDLSCLNRLRHAEVFGKIKNDKL
jgi:hypothetical protein